MAPSKLLSSQNHSNTKKQPTIERVQALVDTLHSALYTVALYKAISIYSTWHVCCNSNETHALIANPPTSAQLGGTLYHSPKSHLGPCSSARMQRGTDRQAHRQLWPLYDPALIAWWRVQLFQCNNSIVGQTDRWAQSHHIFCTVPYALHLYHVVKIVNFVTAYDKNENETVLCLFQ